MPYYGRWNKNGRSGLKNPPNLFYPPGSSQSHLNLRKTYRPPSHYRSEVPLWDLPEQTAVPRALWFVLSQAPWEGPGLDSGPQSGPQLRERQNVTVHPRSLLSAPGGVSVDLQLTSVCCCQGLAGTMGSGLGWGHRGWPDLSLSLSLLMSWS